MHSSSSWIAYNNFYGFIMNSQVMNHIIDTLFGNIGDIARSQLNDEESDLHEDDNPRLLSSLLYYTQLLCLWIAIPGFLTHSLIGSLLYFWVFLLVSAGLLLVLWLVLIHDVYGNVSTASPWQYNFKGFILRIATRTFFLFFLSTSFNYAYLFYTEAVSQLPSGSAYLNVIATEYTFHSEILCYYEHNSHMDDVRNFFVFFNWF